MAKIISIKNTRITFKPTQYKYKSPDKTQVYHMHKYFDLKHVMKSVMPPLNSGQDRKWIMYYVIKCLYKI
jgi:hypothetical protein